MYSLLLRAQQGVDTKIADGRVPSMNSDSGHESGNGDSGTEEIDIQAAAGNALAVAPIEQPQLWVQDVFIGSQMF